MQCHRQSGYIVRERVGRIVTKLVDLETYKTHGLFWFNHSKWNGVTGYRRPTKEPKRTCTLSYWLIVALGFVNFELLPWRCNCKFFLKHHFSETVRLGYTQE